jgi:hypothetical protein
MEEQVGERGCEDGGTRGTREGGMGWDGRRKEVSTRTCARAESDLPTSFSSVYARTQWTQRLCHPLPRCVATHPHSLNTTTPRHNQHLHPPSLSTKAHARSRRSSDQQPCAHLSRHSHTAIPPLKATTTARTSPSERPSLRPRWIRGRERTVFNLPDAYLEPLP